MANNKVNNNMAANKRETSNMVANNKVTKTMVADNNAVLLYKENEISMTLNEELVKLHNYWKKPEIHGF